MDNARGGSLLESQAIVKHALFEMANTATFRLRLVSTPNSL